MCIRDRGNVVGIPFFPGVHCLYIRKDLYEQFGYTDPPKTWGELYEIAKDITERGKDKGIYGFGAQLKRCVQITCSWYSWLFSFGGYMVDEEGWPTVNTPTAIDATKFMCKLAWDTAPPEVSEWDYDECATAFEKGRIVMMTHWTNLYPRLSRSVGRGKFEAYMEPIATTDLCPTALERPCTFWGAWYVSVTSLSAHKDAAWEFIKYFSSKEMDKILADYQDPVRKSSYNDPELRKKYPYYEIQPKIIETGKTRPPFPWYEDIDVTLQEYLSKALVKELSVEDALNEAQRICEGIVKKYKQKA